MRTWGRERQKEDDGKIGKEKVKRRERERREYREEKREIEKRGGGVIRRITYIHTYMYSIIFTA